MLENEQKYLESVKFQVKGQNRKTFEKVVKKTQKNRVKSVVEQIENDPGLEEAVLETLKERKESEDCGDETSEEFNLAVLSLMKTLCLSERKLDDLRYWIQDMQRRGMDLSKIPPFKKLRKTTIQEMLPDGFTSCTTGQGSLLIPKKYFFIKADIQI